LIVPGVDEGVRFDPDGEPVQVGGALDHVHGHGCHLSPLHRERQEAWGTRVEREQADFNSCGCTTHRLGGAVQCSAQHMPVQDIPINV